MVWNHRESHHSRTVWIEQVSHIAVSEIGSFMHGIPDSKSDSIRSHSSIPFIEWFLRAALFRFVDSVPSASLFNTLILTGWFWRTNVREWRNYRPRNRVVGAWLRPTWIPWCLYSNQHLQNLDRWQQATSSTSEILIKSEDYVHISSGFLAWF